ncbi:CDP-alcohol phosphatidyltransferase family protein [Phytohalomonas tamaricis]|uniref:CDP-alcohol phosphatidyltransferase family protein n=1 Tax=Phytohalomonas tamaricis TaxID=2081032 RepID=UPI000D0BCBED|nr:CDP-alcohol phosphatidyltransferase family protein [Phytohalomonas tamaricis]
MLDKWFNHLFQPFLRLLARHSIAWRITPTGVTITGFFIGMAALPLLIFDYYQAALATILVNRFMDGLDGALARMLDRASNAGGFLDICLDNIFYASVVTGFALANPMHNAPAAVILLAALIGTSSTSLAFSACKVRWLERPKLSYRTLHYLDELTRGTGKIAFLIAFCLWPAYFVQIAWGFSALCGSVIVARIIGGYRTLVRIDLKGLK